ncbi:MAG: hypothetical protein LAN59_13010, partial [Acidobacteriia bacterium]|nr:hypothetical protein [Terriglobia bacterium]
MEMEFGARSDTGCVRGNNEDSYGVAPEMSLFVLSDGMGGLAVHLAKIDAEQHLPGNRLFYLATDPEYFSPAV